MGKIDVFGKEWCGHCQQEKKALGQAGANFQFHDADTAPKSLGVTAYPTLVCKNPPGGDKKHVGEMSASAAKAWCPSAF